MKIFSIGSNYQPIQQKASINFAGKLNILYSEDMYVGKDEMTSYDYAREGLESCCEEYDLDAKIYNCKGGAKIFDNDKPIGGEIPNTHGSSAEGMTDFLAEVAEKLGEYYNTKTAGADAADTCDDE